MRGTGSVCLLLFAGLSNRNNLVDNFLRSCFRSASLVAIVESGCWTGEAEVRARALIWDGSAARLLKRVRCVAAAASDVGRRADWFCAGGLTARCRWLYGRSNLGNNHWNKELAKCFDRCLIKTRYHWRQGCGRGQAQSSQHGATERSSMGAKLTFFAGGAG